MKEVENIKVNSKQKLGIKNLQRGCFLQVFKLTIEHMCIIKLNPHEIYGSDIANYIFTEV